MRVTFLERHRWRVALGALFLVSAWEIGVLVRSRAMTPDDADWAAAATLVRESIGPEGLVVFAPEWIHPLGRLWFGEFITLDQASRMDAARYGSIWEVSIRDARAPEVSDLSPTSEWRSGKVTLRHFERPAARVTWDLRARSRLHEVDFRPRRGAILALRYPLESQRLRIEDAQLGDELHVYAGLADYRTRRVNRARALLRVSVDGSEVSRAYIDNGSGWLHLPEARTEPGSHVVEFIAEVAGEDGPIVLDLCVAAESRSSS